MDSIRIERVTVGFLVSGRFANRLILLIDLLIIAVKFGYVSSGRLECRTVCLSRCEISSTFTFFVPRLSISPLSASLSFQVGLKSLFSCPVLRNKEFP